MSDFIVFIPAFNASKTITATLDGVAASAEAYGKIVQVRIVNDCSKDDTFDVAKAYSNPALAIQVWQNDKNLGEQGTINRYFGALKMDCNWVLMIHADDIPKKQWIPEMLKEIEACDQNKIFTVWSSYDDLLHPELTVLPGDNEGSVVTNNRVPEDARQYLRQVCASFHVSGCAFNLDLFEKIGGFDTLVIQHGDADFFIQGILKGYSDIYIRKTLTMYRIIQSSVSFVSKKTNRDIKEMLYFIQKYPNYLFKNDKQYILNRAVVISFKRVIKGTIHADINYAWNSFKYCGKCLVMMARIQILGYAS